MSKELDNSVVRFFAALGVLVFALPLLLAVGVLTLLWRAWWLYPAWAWFVVPLGVEPISFWHFAALIFLLSLATHTMAFKVDDKKTDWGALGAGLAAAPIAWMLLRWMR